MWDTGFTLTRQASLYKYPDSDDHESHIVSVGITVFSMYYGFYLCRKLLNSITSEVTEIFNWLNTSSRITAMGSTRPLTEMSARNLPELKGRWERKAGHMRTDCTGYLTSYKLLKERGLLQGERHYYYYYYHYNYYIFFQTFRGTLHAYLVIQSVPHRMQYSGDDRWKVFPHKSWPKSRIVTLPR
jgi:hypothetical protein